MPIDWFTVVAQVLNFLILVWLLKRFLYKPILHAIDEREKRIAAELADADSTKADAHNERDEFQRKNEQFDAQRAALLIQATNEAKAERQRLLDEARRAADAFIAKRRETLLNDAHNLNQAIARRTQQEVFAIARKALEDLAGTSLEERMVQVFVRRLHELNGEVKGTLIKALEESSSAVTVRTTFGLSPAQCAVAEEAIKETLGSAAQVRFETAPELISGIELATGGQKVAWSIEEYLASLEKGVGELLEEKDKAEPNVEHATREPEPVIKSH